MSHHVDIDDTFKDNLPKLNNDARKQVGAIFQALQVDKFFEPGEDYFFARDPKDQSCACTHINGTWGKWKMVWCYEYFHVMNSSVEAVVVLLVEDHPLELTTIKPRSA
jgi:hypothetical protein